MAQVVGQIRIDAVGDRFRAVVAILPERHLAQEEVAELIEAVGLHEVERVDREYRLRDCERLERQSAAGDLKAGLERSFSPDRALPDVEG